MNIIQKTHFSGISKRVHRTAAFTLVEILVGLSMIFVLASLLFPVFCRARENGKRATCQSNLRQIGLGLSQYAQDYDETLPASTFCAAQACNSAYPRWIWSQLLDPYLKSGGKGTDLATGTFTGTSIWKCPDNPDTGRVSVEEIIDSGYGSDFPAIPYSYAANSNDLNPEGSANNGVDPLRIGLGYLTANAVAPNTPNTLPVRLAQLERPAELIAVCEYLRYGMHVDISTTTAHNYIWAGHSGASNYLFADGHVKLTWPLQTVSSEDGGSASRNLWTRDGTSFASHAVSLSIRAQTNLIAAATGEWSCWGGNDLCRH